VVANLIEHKTMTDFETINYTVTNRVATIKLNRPKAMNAFNQKLRMDLTAAIERAETDDDVRVVILTGEGRGFSAGADMMDGLAGYDDIESQILKEYKPFLTTIDQSPKLYISAVNGACAGIGSALAMTCDFTVMADDAYLYLAFAPIGLIPDGGASYHLVNAMGYKKAMQLFVEAGRLQPQECLEYGLANKVVPANELLNQTQAWAEKLAQGAPLAQKFGKQVLRSAARSSLTDMIDQEAKIQVITSTSEDHINAAMAFFKKEKPVFNGK
jgi:2-(1,2-epoxy-1,2-dihydrophenyl)acetyl-CoA isomerase